MDGWMNEWIDEWTDGWIDGLMNGWMDGWMNRWMNGRVNRWVNRCELDILQLLLLIDGYDNIQLTKGHWCWNCGSVGSL